MQKFSSGFNIAINESISTHFATPFVCLRWFSSVKRRFRRQDVLLAADVNLKVLPLQRAQNSQKILVWFYHLPVRMRLSIKLFAL